MSAIAAGMVPCDGHASWPDKGQPTTDNEHLTTASIVMMRGLSWRFIKCSCRLPVPVAS